MDSLALYVGTLPPDVTWKDLRKTFGVFGDVSKCFVCQDAKRWAKITMTERSVAERLLKVGWVKLKKDDKDDEDHRTLQFCLFRPPSKSAAASISKSATAEMTYTRDKLLLGRPEFLPAAHPNPNLWNYPLLSTPTGLAGLLEHTRLDTVCKTPDDNKAVNVEEKNAFEKERRTEEPEQVLNRTCATDVSSADAANIPRRWNRARGA